MFVTLIYSHYLFIQNGFIVRNIYENCLILLNEKKNNLLKDEKIRKNFLYRIDTVVCFIFKSCLSFRD